MMKRRAACIRSCGRVGLAAWVLLVTACGGNVEIDTEYGTSRENPLDPEEKALFEALLRRRAAAGLGALGECPTLNSSASRHADDMRNQRYLSETGKDGSSVRQRSCEAGYAPGCVETNTMGEVVSSGLVDPAKVDEQWANDATTSAIVMNPVFTVVGIGRSEGAVPAVWAVDLGSAACE
jgi:uncharacterized protein YkwD